MTIEEIAKKTNLTKSTIRYYEKIGLIPEVQRNDSGVRNYTDYDLGWINFSKCMRSSGMPIKAIVEYIKLHQKGDSTQDARKQLLIEQKNIMQEKLRELQETIDRLNKKIENYENIRNKIHIKK